MLVQVMDGAGIGNILMIVAMVAIFYFFLLRPQQQQRKKQKTFSKAVDFEKG